MPTPALVRLALAAALVLPLVRDLRAQRPDSIPLPEHPRPDLERAEWMNLNGRWRFAFDAADAGERAGWARGDLPGTREILVPFSWGAPLSGVADSADIGWYARTVTVPAAWGGRRVFVTFGASDWKTTAWLDGQRLGEFQGGYTPFSFEIPAALVRPGREQRLVVRVDDREHPFKLEGKQGYGKARGMWQTVYLEARGATPLASVRFTPRASLAAVGVELRLQEPAARDVPVTLRLANVAGAPLVRQRVARGQSTVRFELAVPNARRWSLEDPFLHEVELTVGEGAAADRVRSYFGMRTVGVVDLPGNGARYVAINGQPVYLQLALDQAYHPTGFYTFPTDSVLRDEILRARRIGLNGLREHIKLETPRKLYWADRLGVLIMADIPNWWGPPDSAAFREHEVALRAAVERDFNHPSVFSWILFNETWGLTTKEGDKERYLPATQRKVASVYRLAKSLDSTRLVEDNSVCCGRGHTETDLNTWHDYLPGWRWVARVSRASDSTRAGATWNFEPGYAQARQPMLNSEFGNVWGYEGSTGDVDWSFDYRRAMDAFRRYPRLAGWLYTEHHDVINEWNGYWRFDRTEKETGFGDIVPGMTLNDLHAPLYVAVGDSDLVKTVEGGERVSLPLYASFLSPSTAYGDSLALEVELYGWNAAGERASYATTRRAIPYRPWMTEALAPVELTMPRGPGLAIAAVTLRDRAGTALHHNFAAFVITGLAPDTVTLASGRRARLLSVPASETSASRWSRQQWSVLDGKKVNGAGSGYVEYRIPFPKDMRAADVASATFLVEASAKRLNGKDRDSTARQEGDYMRGGGFHDRSRNPNSYPMTSAVDKYPSAVTVRVNDRLAGRWELDDDPADSRGILSWHAQRRDGRLREAGSYGQLLRVPIPAESVAEAARTGAFVVRLEVDESLPGGLAIYGRHMGRYPVNPAVLLVPAR